MNKLIATLLALSFCPLTLSCGEADSDSSDGASQKVVPGAEACEALLLTACKRLEDCGAYLFETEEQIFCVDCDEVVKLLKKDCRDTGEKYAQSDIDACRDEASAVSCMEVCGPMEAKTPACDRFKDLLPKGEEDSDGVSCDSLCIQ